MMRHRLGLAMNYFGTETKAIHFGTAEDIVEDVYQKFSESVGWHLLYVGASILDVSDGVHQMPAYLVLNPKYKAGLLNESSRVEVNGFASRFENFIINGANSESGDRLMNELIDSAGNGSVQFELLTEFFAVRSVIEAKDPVR